MSAAGPGWFNRASLRVKRALGINIILCDSCKWNWRSACNHRERPHATWCRDYTKKGS